MTRALQIPLDQKRVLSRPGYFGRRRHEIEAELNNQHGVGGWLETWQVGGYLLRFEEAVVLYDQSYYEYLKANPYLVEFVCRFAECYDSDEGNVAAGLAHDPAATPRHLQDVSVRRALVALGRWFEGTHTLLRIRDETSNGHILMPGLVPFCQPGLILDREAGGPVRTWVNIGSVEHFWQANKVIVKA